MTQSLAGVLAAIRTSFAPLYAASVGTEGDPVLVSPDGDPGQYQPSAIVAVMETTGKITRPTMGPNRSREVEATINLIFSAFTHGDESAQAVSTDCVLSLMTILEQNLRTAPNERFGGVCRDAWIGPDFTITPSIGVDPDTGEPAGRVTEIKAQMTAIVRY